MNYPLTLVNDAIKEIIKCLYPEGVDLANASDVPHQERFFVISGKNGPRWIVPRDSMLGWPVLNQWRPYNISSRIQWAMIIAAYRSGLLFLVPGVIELGLDGASNICLKQKELRTDSALSPVIYIGTEGPQQKLVITLVDSVSGVPSSVVKVGLGKEARASLLRESINLKLLASYGVRDVPVLLAMEESTGRTWQSVVPGNLTSRKLTEFHIDLLLRFPITGKTTTVEKQKSILNQLIQHECAELSVQQLEVIKTAISNISGQYQIPLILVHGDFAPWNLKKQPNGELAVIDWEDAEFEGLPLWDLCHYHYIQAHLFSKHKLVSSFLSGRLIDRYLQGLGIDKREQTALILLYLLFMIISKSRNTSLEYKTFLIDQIPTFLI